MNNVITADRVGADGRLRIFDIPAKQWVRRHAVDAKEQLKIGTASLRGPNIEMSGPGGLFKCCAEEVDSYLAKGSQYSIVESTTATSKSGDSKESTEPDNETSREYDFEAHTVVELREAITHLGLTGVGTRKSEIIAALTTLEDEQFNEALNVLANLGNES